MKKREIIANLIQNSFTNWQKWDQKECREFVQSHFDCSRYIANEVARDIKYW